MTFVRQSVAENGIKGTLRRLPEFARYQVETLFLKTYNRIRTESKPHPSNDCPEFEDIIAHSQTPTDINDHLERLFSESLPEDPDTIVELGVRGGESTFVFERVARLSSADLVSVDVEDCGDITDYSRWHFVQSDDVEFAKKFQDWSNDREIEPNIDVLFVDTSHLYDHTVNEIDEWFPHLSDRAIVFFHDTNLTRYYRREDGTLGRAWDNDRGVIRALEDYFECSFDESEQFITVQSPFIIKHYPHCNGLTVLQRTPALE